MDCIEDQQPNFKHYCRVCKKGFMCGRALGGHMRAHGIGDESGNLDEEDPTSDWEDKNDRSSNKRMYQLRTNPNRLKNCRICENCGKEFFSWKSFLEHGKCSSDAESLVSSPDSEGEEDEGGGRRGSGGWTKRKRSMRAKVGSTIISSTYPSSEDEDLLLAKCLVQLANTQVELPTMLGEVESSSTSASREEERRNAMANFFSPRTSTPLDKAKGVTSNNSKGMFECKACKKVFNSHQALGGHRASHKKVKGCYAAKQDHDHQLDHDHSLADDDVITHDEFFPASKSPYNSPTLQFEQGTTALVGAARRKSKVHECTICHRVFSSGQALGGHKRCHWITSNSPADTTKLQFRHHVEPINHYKPKIKNSDQALDLNLPAWAEDMGLRRDPRNPLSFEVSTDIHLHPWINTGGDKTVARNINNHPHQYHERKEDHNNNNNNNNGNNNNSNNVTHNVDDEADSRLRLAKLSDLKDMNLSGSSSQWLQVGIGSTTAATADQ